MNTAETPKMHEAPSLEQLDTEAHPAPDDMLTIAELAVRLKTTVRTIETWRNAGVVLPIKVDKVVLFYWPGVVKRLRERYEEREPQSEKRKAESGNGGKALVQPPAKLPAPKAPGPVPRMATPVPTGAGRSAGTIAKRAK